MLVRDALAAVLGGGVPAERAVERALKRGRGLTNAGRAAVARRVYGVACLRRRLAWLVDAPMDGLAAHVPRLVAAYVLDVEGGGVAEALAASGLDAPDGPLRALAAGPRAWPEDPLERLAVRRSLPDWLARLWVAQRGLEDADALAAAVNVPGPLVIRANLLRTGVPALRERLGAEGIASEPCRFAPTALRLTGRANVFGSASWRA
ncbi:MAG: hypothetical protein ACK4N5_20075, partial [Myxococcales bacterium]